MAAKKPSLTIKNVEVCELAAAIAARTGESLTEVVRIALRERLARQQSRPVLDERTDDEIIGYDEHGVPA